MKRSLNILIAFILFSLTLFAQEPNEQNHEATEHKAIKTEEQTKSDVLPIEPITATEAKSAKESKKPSISHLIEEIQKAKPESKRLLMNQLKLQLRQANKAHRQKAILALKKAFANRGNHVQTKPNIEMKIHKNNTACTQQEQSQHQPKFRHLRHQQMMEGAKRREGMSPSRGAGNK